MKVDYLILCRYGEHTSHGELNVLGGNIERVVVDSFPGTYPQLIFVSNIKFPIEERHKTHPFEAMVYGPDGGLVKNVMGGELAPFRAPDLDDPTEHHHTSVALIIGVNYLIFSERGWHKFVLTINGQEAAACEFKVIDRAENLRSPSRGVYTPFGGQENGPDADPNQ